MEIGIRHLLTCKQFYHAQSTYVHIADRCTGASYLMTKICGHPSTNGSFYLQLYEWESVAMAEVIVFCSTEGKELKLREERFRDREYYVDRRYQDPS